MPAILPFPIPETAGATDVPSPPRRFNGNNPLKGRGGKNKTVSDDWLKRLAGITSIRKLSLSSCDITDAGLVHVNMLSGLEEINLTPTPVTDAGFVHPGSLSRNAVVEEEPPNRNRLDGV